MTLPIKKTNYEITTFRKTASFFLKDRYSIKNMYNFHIERISNTDDPKSIEYHSAAASACKCVLEFIERIRDAGKKQ